MAGREDRKVCKVVLRGDSCGKTALIQRFIESKFPDELFVTIGIDRYNIQVSVGGKMVTLAIYGLKVMKAYEQICIPYYKGANAVIFCFDLTQTCTFDSVKLTVNKLKQLEVHEECLFYLCGTQYDLIEEGKKFREVHTHQIREYGEALPAKYIETSAKTGYNVCELFVTIAEDYLSTIRKKPNDSTPPAADSMPPATDSMPPDASRKTLNLGGFWNKLTAVVFGETGNFQEKGAALPRKDISKNEKIEMELVEKHIAEQGSLKLRVVKSIFYGPPAAGKTCTRKRLTGKITNLGFRAFLPSTGIEKPCTINFFHKTEQCSVLLTKSFKEWEEQDVETQCQTILQLIMVDSEVGSDQPDHLSIEKANQVLPQLMSPKPVVSSATADPSLGPTAAVHIATRSSKLLSPPPLPKGGSLGKLIKNVTATKKWKKVCESLKAVEDMTVLHITDTGGQPEFHDILPLLLEGPAIFLVFHNLTKRLHEHCEIGYRWKEGIHTVEYESQFTLKEMLFQLLVSISENPNAAVMFIGTYFDRVGAAGLRHQEKEFRDVIKSTELFKKDVVKMFPQDGKKSLIFPLDNIRGSVGEVKKLRAAIASVIEETFDSVPLPTSWLLFHLVLRREYEANPGYCTLEQCKEVAESCGIPAGIVVDILRFMHKSFGTVLYYDNVPSLADVVICDPNVIFTRATKLVTLSFGANPSHPNMSEKIREFGEIDPSLMEEERKKERSPFSMSHVVDLLTHYNIISQIKKFDGSNVYFMPCLLRPDPIVGREEKRVLRDIHPAPLLILFSTGYIPLGLFSALIVLLSKHGSCVVNPYKCRYRNKVQFVIGKSTDLVLMSHISHLELRIQSPDSSTFTATCPYVVSIIQEAIKYLKSSHKYLKFHNSLGFYCSSDLEVESGTPHPAVCLETDSPHACWNQVSPEVMRCLCKPECARSCSRLLDEHKVWFVQNSGVSANSGKATGLLPQQPPILAVDQLVDVKEELPHFTKWKNLGERLGLHPGRLEEIEVDHNGAEERLRQVLLDWLRRNYNEDKYGSPTWSRLVDAIKPIDHALAVTIGEKHC